MNKRKSTVLWGAVLCLVLVATSLLMAAFPSFAYFRTLFDRQGVNTVMVELIFDHLDFSDPDITAAGYANEENGVEIPWGSERNPYVISQKYHIQNLSVLQNSGFFEGRVEKDENGDPVLDTEGNTIPVQSYFLVCNPDGTPVAIDCGDMTIAPVGTHDVPFTGVIEGAPLDGTTTYNGCGSSVSTIANLTVESNLDEPDIGFFGKLGYHGTYNAETQVVTGGFAARVDGLVLADVTVASRKSLFDALEEWWNSFFDHVNRAEEYEETHHVGIIAGHAEFATVSNVSVYYSENVEAFRLESDESGSNTNYYSSIGLIGLLEKVNPVILDDGSIDGSDAINDSDVIGDGSSGAGGEESGTLTGYFFAKNLIDRHEAYLTAQQLTTKDKYNVMEMKDRDSSDLFKTVTMGERDSVWESWQKKTYFYFQDTVFTFAMSMSVTEGTTVDQVDPEKSDYVQRIWRLEETRPSIPATDSGEKLQYLPDPGTTPRVSYYLEAVTSVTGGGNYVLAYYQKNGTADTTDDVLYVLNLNNDSGYVHAIPIGRLAAEGTDEDELYGDITYYSEAEGSGIRTIQLVGVELKLYDYAFYYDSSNSVSIKSPFLTDYKFGTTANNSNNYYYRTPTTTLNTANADPGSLLGEAAYVYNWAFTAHASEKGRFSVANSYRLGSTIYIADNYTYCWSKLTFSDGKLGFSSVAYTNSSDRDAAISFSDEDYFTIFRVNANTVDSTTGAMTTLGANNVVLSPMNIRPTQKQEGDVRVPDTLYDFDPSKYVLEYVGTSDDGYEGQTIGNYRLAPIRSYKLNDGKGNLLTEINHIAKLYKTHNQNYQLTIGNTFLGNFVGDWLDTNTGGVLNTTIGTSNDELYSIPTGMIAFEINEASAQNPSYINIIVAVNPNQEMTGTVGIWAMNKQTWQQSFNLNNPTESFDLPISKTAKGSSDKKYMLKVTERMVEIDDNGKKSYSVVTNPDGSNEESYIYPGGETVLVYHRFEITATGVYLLGSQAGPFSVAYFSVTGAAGEGEDGMRGSPLSNIDFVYDYEGWIVTTDKLFAEQEQMLNDESYDQYYPSYTFVSMLPDETKIQREVIRIRRYIDDDDGRGTKRHFLMTGQNHTVVRCVSDIVQDMQDDID